jgi:hypothetical protein
MFRCAAVCRPAAAVERIIKPLMAKIRGEMPGAHTGDVYGPSGWSRAPCGAPFMGLAGTQHVKNTISHGSPRSHKTTHLACTAGGVRTCCPVV